MGRIKAGVAEATSARSNTSVVKVTSKSTRERVVSGLRVRIWGTALCIGGEELREKRPTPLSVLSALVRRGPQPQGSYVAPSPQNYSGLTSPENHLNYCFV